MAEILAVDDEPGILQVIKRTLEKSGHQVRTIENPSEIKESELSRYDLILLDVMMPEMDGVTFCTKIRDKVDCPVLFLTAKTMEEDLVMGLQAGGDDYICKPFGISELRARVEAHLRREHREKKHGFSISGLRFYPQNKEVYAGEQKIKLTKSEYEISEFLARNHSQVFSKESIYEKVFGYDGESDSSAITEHIKNIRNKLSRQSIDAIETVWGIGYRWKE